MDTAEIPTFKLAKVGAGRDKERKKGALPFWLGGGGKAAGGLATGGVGLAAKVGVAVLATMMGTGAYQFGRSLAPKDDAFDAPKRAFQGVREKEQKYAGDLSKLPGGVQYGASGLGMVRGSLDGKTPEQRAAEAAAAEAAAKAEAEKQAAADAAAGATPPDAAGAPAGVDPSALAAAAAASAVAGGDKDKDKKFGKQFGALSSGVSGGSGATLAGGSGMSGGVGRTFDSKNLGSNLKRFSPPSTPTRTAARSTRSPGSSAKGLAARQLVNANRLSRQAAASTGEASSEAATRAFENNPGANSAITGGGAGTGSGITGGGTDTTGGGASSGGGGGGPTSATGTSGDGTTTTPTVTKKDVTPWGGMVKIAAMLAIIAGVLLIIAGLLSIMAKEDITGTLQTVVMWIAGIAGLMSLITAIMGMAIIGQGQTMQGGLFTGIGALQTAAAVLVIVDGSAGTIAHGATLAAWAAVITGAAGVLGGGAGVAGAFD